MTSNMPYTYDDVSAALAGTGDRVWWPRPNTKAVMHPSGTVNVFVYGGHIAELHKDGTVTVWADEDMSNTTRNRLNDVLVPLRWKLIRAGDQPVLVSTRDPLNRRNYRTGMIVGKSKGN